VTFDAPLWLLLAPALLLAAVAAARARSRARRRLLPFGAGGPGAGRAAAARRAAEVGGCALLAVALAGPRLDGESSAKRQREPVVFVLDASRSMLAEDAIPGRFAAAVVALLERVARGEGRRHGLVVFAGGAREVCPPTADGAALAALLADLHPRRHPDPGSDVAAGLERALSRLESEGGGEIVVLSDGEWDGDPARLEDALERARTLGIAVVGKCFGTETPSPIVVRDEAGEIVDDGLARLRTAAAPARLAELRGGRPAATDGGGDPSSAPGPGGWVVLGLLLLAGAHALSERDP